VPSSRTVSLWTEFLTKEWRHDEDSRERVSRGRVKVTELDEVIGEIREANSGTCEGVLFMQARERSLQVVLKEDELHLSDPQNPNYQNVKMPTDQLEEFVELYFFLEDEAEEGVSFPVQILQITFFLIVLGSVGTALFFVSANFIQQSSFMPLPMVEEIHSPGERLNISERHSAIYATGVRDGAMVIQLKRSGDFRFYDMESIRPGRYQLVPVEAGTWWAARQAGRVALVTDNHYVFYPNRDGDLNFLQRPFARIASGEAELPHILFPE